VASASRPLLTLVSLIFVGFNGGVPAASPSGLNFIGTGSEDSSRLAGRLTATAILTAPITPAASAWEWDWSDLLASWTREIEALLPADQVVVCTWPDVDPSSPLLELDPVAWRRQVEWPTALWFMTLAAAAGRCRDGGSLVVVVDRPATLDAPGHAAAVTVAEGITNLVRSLAAREGGRSVRVNAVLSARHTAPDGLLGSPPPLATFPGRVDVEIAGAVKLLLSADAVGLTGTAIHATGGRP
jgi:NAD(P)-dependent dehydrogenase (short-subunit alcohol dehydrogenase family)